MQHQQVCPGLQADREAAATSNAVAVSEKAGVCPASHATCSNGNRSPTTSRRLFGSPKLTWLASFGLSGRSNQGKINFNAALSDIKLAKKQTLSPGLASPIFVVTVVDWLLRKANLAASLGWAYGYRAPADTGALVSLLSVPAPSSMPNTMKASTRGESLVVPNKGTKSRCIRGVGLH